MMRALTLDYVKSAQSRKLPIAILVVALLFAAYMAKTYADLKQDKKQWQSQFAQLQQEQQRIQAQRSGGEESAALKPEIVRANETIRRLSLPWDKLFTTLETVHAEDVALLSIQPDAEKHFITINAEAKDMSSMLEYMRRLSKEPMFTGIQLTSHQLQQQDPQKPIRFTVTANWKLI